MSCRQDKNDLLKAMVEVTKQDVQMNAWLVRAKLGAWYPPLASLHAFVSC